MARNRLVFSCLLAWLSLGCPAADDANGDDAAGTGASTGVDADPTPCEPGVSISCACVGGPDGTQVCEPSGQAYGACDCEGSQPGTTSGSSNPSTSEGPGDGAESDTGSSGGGPSGSSDGDGSTGAQACEPGTVMACDCDRGPGAAVCNRGGTGYSDCMCCEGTHPLVEGDLRYCEEGHCYCGNLDAKPPIDACYGELVAEACCPVELECY